MAFSVYPSGPHKCHLLCHSVQIYENTVLDLVLVNFWKGPGSQLARLWTPCCVKAPPLHHYSTATARDDA